MLDYNFIKGNGAQKVYSYILCNSIVICPLQFVSKICKTSPYLEKLDLRCNNIANLSKLKIKDIMRKRYWQDILIIDNYDSDESIDDDESDSSKGILCLFIFSLYYAIFYCFLIVANEMC